MTLPPSDFAATFRAHVIPQLREMMPVRGLFVALGIEGFTEAHGTVMRRAAELGAYHLPPEHLSLVDDWIGTALLDAIREKQPVVDAGEALADRVAKDIAAWEAGLRGR